MSWFALLPSGFCQNCYSICAIDFCLSVCEYCTNLGLKLPEAGGCSQCCDFLCWSVYAASWALGHQHWMINVVIWWWWWWWLMLIDNDDHRHHCTLVRKMCRLDREEESQRSLSPGYQARRQPWTRWWWWRWWRRWWLRWWWLRCWWWRWWLWWWWWVRWWWWWLWWLYLYGQQEWEKGEVKSQCLPAMFFVGFNI